MRFEARNLNPFAEPVTAADLREHEIYFAVQFLDEEMLIPTVETLVYLGRDLFPEDHGRLYFQDADSYQGGVRIDNARREEATLYNQSKDEISHIFAFERALEQLMACSLRRRGVAPR